MSVLLALHVLAAVVWVGGMFFAYVCLRPVAAAVLEPPQRLTLWRQVLARFFVWVWISVATLFASGYAMIFGVFDGFGGVGIYVHIMHGLGIVMLIIFAHVFFAPFRRRGRHVDAQEWPAGGKALAQVRVMVAANLAIGLALVAVASGGRWF